MTELNYRILLALCEQRRIYIADLQVYWEFWLYTVLGGHIMETEREHGLNEEYKNLQLYYKVTKLSVLSIILLQ